MEGLVNRNIIKTTISQVEQCQQVGTRAGEKF